MALELASMCCWYWPGEYGRNPHCMGQSTTPPIQAQIQVNCGPLDGQTALLQDKLSGLGYSAELNKTLYSVSPSSQTSVVSCSPMHVPSYLIQSCSRTCSFILKGRPGSRSCNLRAHLSLTLQYHLQSRPTSPPRTHTHPRNTVPHPDPAV